MNPMILQLADSAFPTGGFAHSAGLEAAAQAGAVAGRAGVERFARDAIWQAACAAWPLAQAAHADPARIAEWDARADAFLVNHVANRASRLQGRAFLETCSKAFPAVRPLRQAVRDARLHQHVAPLQGAVARALGIDRADCARLLLFISLRGVLSAAVRLGVVGTLDAQALQAELAPALDQAGRAAESITLDDLAQTAPLADLLQATHDRLYSRLFLS